MGERRSVVNAIEKLSLRGATRRGNLLRLLHFVRNDTLRNVNLFKAFTTIRVHLFYFFRIFSTEA